MNILAPGVYSTVTDLSTTVDSAPGTVGFLAFIGESGRDNELVRVSRSTLLKEYGNPNINYTNDKRFGFGLYVAENFLTESNNMYVIRALPDDAQYSNIYITTTTLLDDLDASGNVDDQTIACSIKSVDSINKATDFSGEISTGIDDTSASGYTLLGFRGLGRGEFYNNFLIDINKHPNTGINAEYTKNIYIVDIYQLQKYSTRFTTADSTTTDGYLYSDYVRVETFEVSFDPEAKDLATDSLFIEDVINRFSSFVRVTSNRTILKEMARRTKLDTSSGELTINFAQGFVQSYTNSNGTFELPYGNKMLYGSSGSLFTQYGINTDTTATAYAGNVLARAYAGTLGSSYDGTSLPVSGVLDTENYQFDLIFDAGYPDNVKSVISELASTRRDCMAILDNGEHFTASSALTTRESGATFAYNTAFTALFEPYSKVYDVYTGTDLWVPPTYHVSKIIGFSDRTTQIWWPFAGMNRGVISSIKELRYNPSLSDRENFRKYQLNPIVKFPTGYALFSENTTMRRNSVLNDIHVIRLQAYIDRLLKQFCLNFVYELNDEETRGRIRKEINIFLADVKSNRGLDAYSIDIPLDPYDIKRKRIPVNIQLTPVRAVEQIFLNYFVN